MNESLDSLVLLFDVCSAAKEVLLTTKVSTQELQLVLHRKRGDKLWLARAVEEYLTHWRLAENTIHCQEIDRDGINQFHSIRFFVFICNWDKVAIKAKQLVFGLENE